MPMEELTDASFRGVFRLLSLIARSLIWLIWELCFETVAWYVGWPICRVVSLGRYPRETIGRCDDAGIVTSILVPLVGMAFLVALAVAFGLAYT